MLRGLDNSLFWGAWSCWSYAVYSSFYCFILVFLGTAADGLHEELFRLLTVYRKTNEVMTFVFKSVVFYKKIFFVFSQVHEIVL